MARLHRLALVLAAGVVVALSVGGGTAQAALPPKGATFAFYCSTHGAADQSMKIVVKR